MVDDGRRHAVQIVAFLTFQIRVAAGLRALADSLVKHEEQLR